MADHAFVAEEAPKIVQLVETGEMDRAIPIVSFVARQRDLLSTVLPTSVAAACRLFL